MNDQALSIEPCQSSHANQQGKQLRAILIFGFNFLFRIQNEGDCRPAVD
ncbi:MAG: hypothetical protein FWE95_08015 [Planctomycetaceae bacterium]|nr:hypothetical protein [Planctomycetaceae bacterium]